MFLKKYLRFSLYISLFFLFDVFLTFIKPFIGIYLFIFFIGSFIGSFWLVLIDRIPKGRSIFAENTCDVCGYVIPEEWTLPIIPYILQKGKCLNCKTHISIRYPLTEALFGTIFCSIVYFTNFFCLLYFIAGLSAFSFIYIIIKKYYF
ncbi:prepilin peptidase [Thermoanaerobacter thermohydrosulfuricus]